MTISTAFLSLNSDTKREVQYIEDGNIVIDHHITKDNCMRQTPPQSVKVTVNSSCKCTKEYNLSRKQYFAEIQKKVCREQPKYFFLHCKYEKKYITNFPSFNVFILKEDVFLQMVIIADNFDNQIPRMN